MTIAELVENLITGADAKRFAPKKGVYGWQNSNAQSAQRSGEYQTPSGKKGSKTRRA